MKNKVLYPISYVSRQTGLPAHLIRTWESRYQAVKPFRSEKNRRLYCDQDIARLQSLSRLVDSGHSISQVAHLSPEELADLERIYSSVNSRSVDYQRTPHKTCSQYLEAAFNSAINLDNQELESTLNTAAVNLTRPQLLFGILVPLQARLLKMVNRGSLRYVHLNVANTVIRSFLWDMLRTVAIAESAPRLVVAAPIDHHDEISSLILAATAVEAGWRPFYIGTHLPASDIAAAVKHYKADVVVLRLIQGIRDDDVSGELINLRRELSGAAHLLICCGDKPSEFNVGDAGTISIPRLEDFRHCLESLPKKLLH